MKKTAAYWLLLAAMLTLSVSATAKKNKPVAATWPDGSVMDAWFQDTTKVALGTLGRQYVLTDYGVVAGSPQVQTSQIQAVIDRCAQEGGGVVVVPTGTYVTGALFFRQGTHLYVGEGATLRGSDRIADYPILTTRIEGETCKYFCALINADGLDGFTISGPGTIDGNGLHYWQEFWIRRKWNPQCTNKDAQRPRLTYISHSKNVTILGCYIYAPTEHIFAPDPSRGAPSSDAIDVDACTDILIDRCFMHVNDDAVVMKGGKGTWADKDSTNGPCERVVIQNCHYGRVHGCLTLGSEAVHCRNIILRNCHTERADRVLWLKMRPDTPQHYEYVLVENITGHCGRFLFVHPWTQFFKPEQRDDMPLSRCNNIVMRHIQLDTDNMFDVKTSDKYQLSDFTLDGQPVTF